MSTAPPSNRDFDFFYQGIAEHRFLVQRCRDCGAIRHPAGPMCPRCQSLRWEAIELKGTGTIYSYTVHYYPPLPDFECPHVIAVAEMSEGVRIVAAVRRALPSDVHIGQDVRLVYVPQPDGETRYALECVGVNSTQ